LILLLYEATIKEGFRGLDWRRHATYWGVAVVYVIATGRLINEALVDAPVRDFKIQLATQLKAAVYYLKLMVIPHSLSVEHAFYEAFEPLSLVPLLACASLGSIALVLWLYRKRIPGESRFWFGWILISLLPTIVVPLNVLVSERRLYLPLIGFLGGLLALRALGARLVVQRVGVVAMIGLGLLSFQRNRVWADEKSLWLDARTKGPSVVRAHLQLGRVWRQQGRIDSAAQAYRVALALEPNNAAAYNNIGNIKKDIGDLQGAEVAYRKALEIQPRYPEAQINLGALYSKTGRYEQALAIFTRALVLGENHAELHNNRGIALLETGQFDAAVESLKRAIDLGGGKSGVYFNLGGALEGMGEDNKAIAAYEQALGLAPDNPKPHYNLGLLHERLGNTPRALKAYQRFLVLWRGEERFKKLVQDRIAGLQRQPQRSANLQD